MDGATLQTLAAERAMELPGTELTHPFRADQDVYKVRGKMFLLFAELAEERVVILKATPDEAAALRAQFEGITPGYHMNKRHWITVHPRPDVDAELVADLVTESYLLVVETLPRRERPVDPATFGRV